MGHADPSDPYRLLGLGSGATETEVRRAFRRLARLAHPDAGGDPARFVALRRAHDLLCDPVARAALDAARGEAVVTAGQQGSGATPSDTAERSGPSAGSGLAAEAETGEHAARLRSDWGALEERWRHEAASVTPIDDAAGLTGSAVVLGAMGGGGGSAEPAVVAIEAGRGDERWRAGLATPVVGSPVVVGGLVVVATTDGVVHGLDPRRGATRWERRLATEPVGVVRGGDVVIVAAPDSLTALGAEGDVRWVVRPHGGIAAVVPAGPVVVLRTGAGAVVGVDPRTGGTRWWLRGAARWAHLPVTVGPWLWLPDGTSGSESAGRLVAVDPRTGAAAHALRCPAPVVSAHEVGGLLVLRDAEEGLTAVRHGRPQWRMVVPAQPSAPVAVDEAVAVATADGVLRFLSGRHGTELHQVGFASPAGGCASLLMGDGLVVMAGVDGGVVAHRVVTRAEEPSPR